MSFTYLDDAPVPTATPQAAAAPQSSGKFTYLDNGNTVAPPKPFYDALGANMTPEMKAAHPVLSGIEQTAQDVSTLGEKAANGLSLGLLDKGLNKAGIQPPNFDNTAPENKSGLNLAGETANMAGGIKTLGVIGDKAPAMASAFGNRLVKAASELPENINNLASPIRDYAGNKVNAIRNGAKLFWKSEMGAYGKGLDNLANNPKQVPLNNLMQNATKTMVDRKLYDPIQQKWVNPLTPVDSQLVKSYKQLSRNFSNNGTASVGDIVREYQKIRDSAPIGTSMGREARTVASDFLKGASKDIDLPEYQKLNERYSDFKNKFDTIDSKIDVWGNPEKTARGENFLTRGLSKTMEARKAAQNIQANTGQSLKGAKVLNAINNLPLKKFIMP